MSLDNVSQERILEQIVGDLGIDPVTGLLNSISEAATGATSLVLNVKDAPYSATGNGITDDRVAIQAAIDAARAAGGGTVFFPRGTYKIGAALTRPSDTPVNLVGVGEASVIKVTADFGAGQFALDISNYDPETHVRHVIANLYVQGYVGGLTPGVAPMNMWGVKTLAFDCWRNVRVQGFKCGAYIREHHEEFQTCNFEGNYYGAYWGAGATNENDQSFRGGNLAGCTFASAAVASGEIMGGVQFYGTHLGFSPYCIYREAAAAGDFMVGALFFGAAFESHGNGLIFDESKTGIIRDTRFLECQVDFEGQASAFNAQIAARAHDWVIVAGTLSNVKISGSRYTLPTNALGLGFIDCNVAELIYWEDMQPIIDNLVAEGGSLVQATNYVDDFRGRSATTDLEVLYVPEAVAKNDLLFEAGPPFVTKTTGVSPRGVALQAGTSKYIPVAIGGRVSVKATGAIAALEYVKPSGSLDGAAVTNGAVRSGFGIATAAASGGLVAIRLAPLPG